MKLKAISVVVFTVVVLAICLGCAQQQKPAAQTNQGEIVIGFLDDMSGPSGALGSSFLEAQNDALRYINEEKGGVSGYTLKAIAVDHKMESSLAIAGWERMRNAHAPVVFSITAAAVGYLTKACEADRITILTGGGTFEQSYPTKPSFWFNTTPHVVGTIDAMFDMIQKDWVKQGKTGTPKVCVDIVSFGNYQKIYGKAFKLAAEKRAIQYIVTYTGMSQVDVSTQLLQAKGFNSDYVCLINLEGATISWLKEMERQNFHPRVFGYTSLGGRAIPQATGQVCVGATYPAFGPMWTDTDLPYVEWLHSLNAKWHPEIKDRSAGYVRAFSNFVAVVESLKRAIQNVGYANLDGDAVRQAMETIKDYDPLNAGSPYTWTSTDHDGAHGCLWYTWTDKGGTILGVKASDWYEFAPLPEEQRTTNWWLQ